jgi:hypothetical protein
MSDAVTGVLEDAGFDENADGYVYVVRILRFPDITKMLYVGETTQHPKDRFRDHGTITLSGDEIVYEFDQESDGLEGARKSRVTNLSENPDGTHTVSVSQQRYVRTEMVGNNVSLPAPDSDELRSNVAFELESLYELRNYCDDMDSCETESHACDDDFTFDDFKAFLRLKEKETYDRLVCDDDIHEMVVGGK